MNYVELLLQYNGFLLMFSATGFLISLLWVVINEKGKRKVESQKQFTKKDVFDEKVFFGEFESLENPAMKRSDLKPIFDNILPNDSEIASDSQKNNERKFIKMNELPKFPTLKKEIEDTLDSKTNDKKEVKGLLNEIKKDIKKNTKGSFKK